MAVPVSFQQAGMLLLDPSEAAEGHPSPSHVFLNNVFTVSQEGAPDGEGNSAGHDPAAPASKGGRRKRGCSFLCDSWCPGSTGLRHDRMGEGGWVTTSSIWMLRGLLSPPLRNQCAWINYGDTELRGLSVERWITFALLRLRWEVCTLDHGGGTGLLNLPLNVSQRHLDCVINRSILHRTWKAFHLSPIREKLAWILLEKCLFSCTILLFAAIKISLDSRTDKKGT